MLIESLCYNLATNKLQSEMQFICSWVMYMSQLTRQRIIFCSLNQELSNDC